MGKVKTANCRIKKQPTAGLKNSQRPDWKTANYRIEKQPTTGLIIISLPLHAPLEHRGGNEES